MLIEQTTEAWIVMIKFKATATTLNSMGGYILARTVNKQPKLIDIV